MKTVNVKMSWHKATDKWAITYSQLKYISSLRNEENCPNWPFISNTNAMRSLTKDDAQEIIEALKSGDVVVFDKKDIN